MQATEIVLPAVGEPESLRLRVRELPRPAPGQAVVRIEASGVTFAEQQMRRGKYYDMPAFPFVPGYDLVGIVEEVGPPVPGRTALSVGQRVAALTKTGGWADRVLLDAADLVPVPDGVAAADAETVVTNGATAWRMLYRTAHVRPGDTIVVHGANGGVGSVLVQLARCNGITVIGTASARNQQAVAAMGALPVDYRGDIAARVRELAPQGVAAVFDHVGGKGIKDSWRMLAPGGTLVSYGSASTRDQAGNGMITVLKLLARLGLWNVLPNRRGAHFFNLWAGKARRPEKYRAELREDLAQIFALLRSGAIEAKIDRVYPLHQASAALRHAESGTAVGKIVIVPATTTE
ncbi:medium chain dehydrogenase/reductase family protein [Streptomyces yaanensis]|uniref:Medium chain dehydrogenase/reductase family protein n=1 Tax=Streptomyces yaanensis TaxID=1142239 RepID=A0ABV7SAP7_9ACTN|nr:medium chain dehydrogenase/reductase family protein [Streptomyces sp. CGMCC 4.7035]WNC02821.1 medium chain dehydrogenase/reductase family protein [Streptomyces sp. CGMCC 4.7035]